MCNLPSSSRNHRSGGDDDAASTRRNNSQCALDITAFAMLRTTVWLSTWLLVASAATSLLGIGYHAADPGQIEDDFRAIAQHFGGVRTFLTHVGPVNTIDVAAKVGIKIAVGVPLEPKQLFDSNVEAAIDGAKSHPDTLDAVYVGNEELLGGMPEAQLVHAIRQAKQRLVDAGLTNVSVGTVQTDGSFLEHPQVADACDVMGVNIHPFFSEGPPAANFRARWQVIKSKFSSKARLTETGWPSAGGRSPTGQTADLAVATAFFKDFQAWHDQEKTELPYWFMFQDVPSKGGYETYFGLSTVDGKWKVNLTAASHGPSAVAPLDNAAQALAAGHQLRNDSSPTVSVTFTTLDGLGLTVQGNNIVAAQGMPANFSWRQATSSIETADGGCWTVSEQALDVEIVDCDKDDPQQKWIVEPRVNHVKHVTTQQCVEVSSTPEHHARLTPCDETNREQQLRVGGYEDTPCTTVEKNVDYAGNDIGHAEAETIGGCCNLCLHMPTCRAFSLAQGMCWLKSSVGVKTDKQGVDSAALA
ncbi:unnamed protein product [Aphanomyces euteiches]